MTRERMSQGGALLAPRPAHSRHEVASEPHFPAWEDWYRTASHVQQIEVLDLARQQGFVHAHQLPKQVARPQAEAGSCVAALTLALSGRGEELSPIAASAVACIDATLGERRVHALHRILATTDFCLVRRRVGHDHLALLAEAVLQIVRRGERILLVAGTQSGAESVLERLVGKSEILPLLYAERETAELLVAITPERQAEALKQQALRQAKEARERPARRIERRAAIESIYEEIGNELVRRRELDRQLDEARLRAAKVSADVEAESYGLPGSGRTLPSGPFSLELIELIKRRNHAIEETAAEEKRVKSRLAELTLELVSAELSLSRLDPLMSAKRNGRWWSLAYWRSRSIADLETTHGSLTAKTATLRMEQAALETQLAGVAARISEADAELKRQTAELTRSEIGRRQREWDHRVADLEAARTEWEATWQRRVMTLEKEEHRPAERTPAALAEARQRWLEAWAEDEQGDGLAHRWAAFLEEAAEQMSARLPRLANVVAGSLSAVNSDARFADAMTAEPFDWVIVEEAEKFGEADLLPLVRRTPRLVLVGPPASQETIVACPSRMAPFHKLWRHLHGEGGSRYFWTREGDRLCCTLLPLSLQERAHLECENLADFPEIELRVLVLPKSRPCLAQVVFPASMGVAEAKQFIYRELQEVAVERMDSRTRWEDRPDAWMLHLGLFPVGPGSAVELDRGVREILFDGSDPCPTSRLEFAKCEGWTWPNAADWVRRYLDLRDIGRTCDLV